MNTLLKRLTILSIAAASYNVMFSQELPTMYATGDIRSAGMGFSVLNDSRGALLHSNPTAIFNNDDKLYASYTIAFPQKAMDGGRQTTQLASVGYKITPRHAVFAGLKYWRSSDVDIIDFNTSKIGRVVPKDRGIDLGYAFSISKELSIFSSLSYLNSYNSQTAHVFCANLGVSYFKQDVEKLKGGAYGANFSINNIGPKYYYGNDKENKNNLPLYLKASGNVSINIMPTHKLTVATAAHYILVDKENKSFLLSIGSEYDMKDIVAVRMGVLIEKGHTVTTFGLGRQFGRFGANLSYSLMSMSEFSMINCGITINI